MYRSAKGWFGIRNSLLITSKYVGTQPVIPTYVNRNHHVKVVLGLRSNLHPRMFVHQIRDGRMPINFMKAASSRGVSTDMLLAGCRMGDKDNIE